MSKEASLYPAVMAAGFGSCLLFLGVINALTPEPAAAAQPVAQIEKDAPPMQELVRLLPASAHGPLTASAPRHATTQSRHHAATASDRAQLRKMMEDKR